MTILIDVPASQPGVLTKPEGDPGGVDAFAETLYAASARYEELSDHATSSATVLGFMGAAAQAYGEKCSTIADEHEGMATTVERVARAVTAYGDTLRDLLRDGEDLVERKQVLDDQREQLLASVASLRGVAVLDPAVVEDLRQRAAALAGAYVELVRDDLDLQRRVQEAETLVRESLQSGAALDSAVDGDGGGSALADRALAKPGSPLWGPGGTFGLPPSPEAVNAWWEGLSEAEREAVIAARPDLVGRTDGIPADARDDANRILLDDDLATLGAKEDDGTLSDDERRVLDNVREAQEALADADGLEDPLTGDKPGGQLYLYDPAAFDGDGRVALAVGDLDTADDVAVFTPGINTDMQSTSRYGGQMANLYESTRYNGDGSSVATMFYLGYDAPDGPTDLATVTEGRAEDGGRDLADMVDGLRATRPDDPAHLTAIGHSYGSTTTAYAAAENDLDVDDVVLLGSPGAGPADHASELGVGEDHVYVGRDSRDGVAFLGDEGWAGKGGLGLGTDPSSEDFGATRFDAESTDRAPYPDLEEAHGRYLDHDSESLYNLGRIVDGHGDDANEAARSFDPLLGPPIDPEWFRDPSTDVPGESRTRDPEDR